MPGPRWFLVLSLVALAIYTRTLGAWFVSDDFGGLVRLARARSWLDGADVYGILDFWRPITGLSLWLELRLHGDAPVPFHAVNLLLHVLAAWLLGRLLYRLSSSRPTAIASSLCFVTCPYHTEAVAWMAARSDLLCAVGTVLCLSAAYEWLRGGRYVQLALAVGAMAFALGSKETAVILAILPLVVPGTLTRPTLSRLAVLALLLAATAAAYLVLRWLLYGGLGGYKDLQGNALALSFAPAQVGSYLAEAFGRAFATGSIPALAVGATLVGLVVAWRVRRTRRTILALAAGFVIVNLPAAGWATIGPSTLDTRLLYVPSLFANAVLGCLLGHALIAAPRVGLVATCALILNQTAGLLVRNERWETAAGIARQMVDGIRAEVRTATPTHLWVCDWPRIVDGVRVFNLGDLQYAVWRYVDEHLAVEELATEHWTLVPSLRASLDAPFVLALRWDHEARRWDRR